MAEMVFLVKGHAILGQTTRDRIGNVVKHTEPHFDFDDDGGSVAVGLIDAETMEIKTDPLPQFFGDYDPAGYLSEALKLIKPKRRGNIPDFKAIVKESIKNQSDTSCPFLENCHDMFCKDCIVKEWIEEEKNV